MPRISVLLPVHNGERHLAESISSVLAQTFRDFELLVIDDGSTDPSAEIARSFRDPRVRLLRNARNLGLAASLNHGLREARAELVARQDADDISEPERLERQLGALSSDSSLALLGTHAWQLDDAGRKQALLEHACELASIRWELLFDNAFFHASVIFRKDAVLGLGGYDDSFRYCQDFALWSRLTRAFPAANLAQPLVGLRAHEASMTRTMSGDNLAENRRILASNFSEEFKDAASAADAEVALAYRAPSDAAAVAALIALWDRRLPEHLARYPAASRSRDLRETLARQWVQLALNRSGRSAARSLRLLFLGARRGLPVVAVSARLLRARRFPLGRTVYSGTP